jgi:uncharacterized protein YggE
MASNATTVGSARVAARPDRAVLRLELVALKPTPSEALADVAARGEVLARTLADDGVGEGDRTTRGVTLREHREWDRRRDEETFRGHHASTITVVQVRDIATLGRILRDVVDEAGARVTGPEWVVDAENPARLEAYRLAALDARRRAQAYAEALGMSLGAVIELSDAPAPRPGPEPMPRMLQAVAADAAPVPVEAGDVDVDATVRVTFALLPGSASP